MSKYIVLIAACFGMLATISVSAQLEVETGVLTPDEYVNDVLLGTGIAASNVTFTGSSVQIGHFTNGGSVGIEEGVMLSSEHVNNTVIGGVGGTIPAGEDVSGEPDLLTLAQSVPALIGQSFNVSSVNDVAILEFDFVPTGDTLSFDYVFGSDEWTGWINSSYNDIFGFFLAGPGITGTYGAPAGFPDGSINIAQVPGTDPPLPITISSVNNGNPDGSNCQYCEYYVYNNPNVDIAINAHTTVLTATSLVECGETYHIRLAIADGSDTALESIVLLEAGSFTSNSVVDVVLSTDVAGDTDILFEDCGEASLTFTRPPISIIDVDEMVIMTYDGTATNGEDYTLLPDTVIIPGGVQSVTFELDAFEDTLSEGIEIVIFEMLNISGCNGSGLTTYFEFEIWDNPDTLTVTGFASDLCLTDSLELIPIIEGGYGNFEFVWSTGDDVQDIWVSPEVSTDYILTVNDTCGMPSDSAIFPINVLIFNNLEVEILGGDIEISCGDFLPVIAEPSGGDGVYSNWSWTNQDGMNLWGFNGTLNVSTWTNADSIFVSVEDGCGFVAQDSVSFTVDIPELFATLPNEIEVGCNEDYVVSPVITGGGTVNYFSWYENGIWMGWQPTYTVSADNDLELCVNVSDNCGQNVEACTDIIVIAEPIELNVVNELVGPCTEIFTIEAFVSGGSGIIGFEWEDEDGNNLGNSQTINFQTEDSTVVTVNVSDQCFETNTADVAINIVNTIPVIDVGEDIYGSCVNINNIMADVTDGEPDFDFEWTVNGDVVGVEQELDYQSGETVQIFCTITDACGGSDTDDMVLYIPEDPVVLEVTPDTAICLGSAIALYASATGGEGGFSYFWTDLDEVSTVVQVEPGNPTEYGIIATDICGKTAEDVIFVDVQDVYAKFTAQYLGDNEIQFTSEVEPDPCLDCNYEWDFGDGSGSIQPNPYHVYDGLQQYFAQLTVTNEIGCRSVSWDFIQPPVNIFVPNAFTPDGDGYNDAFFVVAQGVVEYELFIFNRWGEVVYTTNDPEAIWMGNHQSGGHYIPDGTYPYLIKYKNVLGDNGKVTGFINVLR